MTTGGLVWLSVRGGCRPAIQSVTQSTGIQSARRVGGCEISGELAVRRAQSISGTQFAVLIVHAGTKEILFSIKNEMILMYLIWH